jgi:alcohol dehydrogenase class IV
MEAFEYNSSPARVIFGSGTLSKLPAELQRQSVSAPLLLSTPRQSDISSQITGLFDGKIAGLFTEAAMHTPVHITEKALAYLESVKADSLISVGGGSTIGLGKALSIRTGLPHICVPTTYAGSEMTPILGETKDGKKVTRSDPGIIPRVVIYDVDLTMSLPVATSATSGMNAIAHAGQ